jgi:adenylate cyclase
MNTQDFKRKLTAVFSADVAGYSRLMGEDEAATVKTLEIYKGVMFTLIKQHRGRVIDSPGDNLLAEFASVVDAVQCAVAVQKELQARNSDLPEERKMRFRIGINLGDVIEEEGRLYGDGVNIAARLESLADPGGICVSKTAFDQIETKLPLGYEYLGEQQVKNIEKPIGAYKVLMEPRIVGRNDKAQPREVSFWRHKPVLLGVISIIVLLIAGAVWNFSWREKKVEPAPVGKTATPLPQKASIAVLPFANMSDDREQEFFSDGMTEELIGALAKVEGLKVISRTSAFHFKGKQLDLRTIGEKLGVEHVLEGSVRKAGNKLRISAQLIKVADDAHLWAETYDRDLKDVFNIQDEISRAVVNTLKVKLLGSKGTPLVSAATGHMEAYNLLLKGRYFQNQMTVEGLKNALQCFEKAIEIDPGYAPAYASVAQWHTGRHGREAVSRDETYPKALEAIKKALELDSNLPEAHVVLGTIKCQYEWDRKSAEKSFKRALELNPGLAMAHSSYSSLLSMIGRCDESISQAEKAMELDPLSPQANSNLGASLLMARRYDPAINQLKHTLEMFPRFFAARIWLISSYVGKGMFAEAISVCQKGLSNDPTYLSFLSHMAWVHALMGKSDEARRILDNILEASEKGFEKATPVAKIFAALGDMDRAFEYLEKAYQTREVSGFQYIKVYPDFDNLRSDPRFGALLKKMGLAE